MSIALFMRAMISLRAGELDDAEADARASLDQCVQYRIDFVLPGPLAILVDVFRERDDLEGARALLVDHDYLTGDGNSLFHLFLLHARGRWYGACEQWDDAIADLHRGWRRSRDTGITSPNLVAWQANIAFAEVMSGRPDAGTRDTAKAALREAELFGSVRSRAEAQRALAMAGDPSDAALAFEASETFARLGARMETCRTLLTYAATSAAGTPAAVDALVEALRQAETFGAERLAFHARSRLRSAGVRRSVRPVSGPGALTAGERRVATLAAVGRTNKEIAQELFVTVKTVETHLSRTYQKLLITSRAELQQALSAGPG